MIKFTDIKDKITVDALSRTVKKINTKAEEYKKDEKTKITPEEFVKLPEEDKIICAFAAAKNAVEETTGKIPYDVQILAGLILHEGNIAEMRTGEGKTLVSVLPGYLNALSGYKVNIITSNEFLASRDLNENRKIFEYLGLQAGRIYENQPPEEKRKTYEECSVIYGTAANFGFDYLRDNISLSLDYKMQPDLKGSFAIIDEADSILIDEAKTPLIIAGSGKISSDIFRTADELGNILEEGIEPPEMLPVAGIFMSSSEDEKQGDYYIVSGDNSVVITEKGVDKVEEFLIRNNLETIDRSLLMQRLQNVLKIDKTVRKNIEYITINNEVILIDSKTGRRMDGRQLQSGLHQAIQIREDIEVTPENIVTATVTLQSYFKMYGKISGMTGTCKTDEKEIMETYNMDVVAVPTNRPVIRKDNKDLVFSSVAEKHEKLMDILTEECFTKKRPVLIGTDSVKESEIVSALLKSKNIAHTVLNAVNDEKEAFKIAQAGKSSAITVSTNMAGRGTDILPGGNPEYIAKENLTYRGYKNEDIEYASQIFHTDDPEILRLRDIYRMELKTQEEITKRDRKKVLEAGGLYVIGMSRNTSERVDNQLRGRSGRQGDPGESIFLLSLKDSIVRENMDETVRKKIENLEPGDKKGSLKIISYCQKNTEKKDYESRKKTREYGDIDDFYRKAAYTLRDDIITGDKNALWKFLMDNLISAGNPDGDENPDDKRNSQLEIWSVILEYSKDNGIVYSENPGALSEALKQIISDKDADLFEDKDPSLLSLRYTMLSLYEELYREFLVSSENLKEESRISSLGTIKPVERYKDDMINLFGSFRNNFRKESAKSFLNVVLMLKNKRKEDRGE